MSCLRRLLPALGFVILTPPLARSDEVLMRDGRRYEGRIVEEAGERIVLRLREGRVVLPREGIAELRRGPSVFDELDARERQAAEEGSAEAHLRLAAWCRAQGLAAECRAHARTAVAKDPDCAGARRLLGEEQVRGTWMPREQAMAALGYVRRGARWISPEELEEEARSRGRARELRRLEEEANRLARRILAGDAARSLRARDALMELARRERIVDLESLAQALHEEGSRRRLVRMDVRLHHARLLGLEPRTLSLGKGPPVTIELPRLQATQVSTSVMVHAW
jgi:hypothetical protein